MIKAEQIAEILSLYKKHGWILRRVLLSDELRVNLTDALQDLFGGVPLVSSDLNAGWFSRSSNANQETWELRRLSANPFALVETFDADDEEEIREETRREIETEMKNTSN
jgi:hypothetical protein